MRWFKRLTAVVYRRAELLIQSTPPFTVCACSLFEVLLCAPPRSASAGRAEDAGRVCWRGCKEGVSPASHGATRPVSRAQTAVPGGGLRCVCFVVMCRPGCTGRRGGVGAEWGSRRGGTCAPLCFVQRATDLPACCLSLASRFPPLGSEEPPPLLCAPTLCFPYPPESKGGGRAMTDGPESI